MEGLPSEQGDPYAILRAKGTLHAVALFRLLELLLQQRLEVPCQRYSVSDDKAGGLDRRERFQEGD